jgi:putative PIN family toxin of toxin-antitoxin system
MLKKVDEIIIDTNLWISFLISKDFKQIDSKIFSGEIKILFSQELLEEFIEVTKRPKFRKYFTKKDIDQILDLFDVYGKYVNIKTRISFANDPKDSFLLSLANDARADYLITGDKQLLALKKFGRTRILQFSEYIKTFI